MLITVDAALEAIVAGLSPTEALTVPITQAAGRVLAASIRALTDQPPFAASSMDGYAVQAEEVRDGARLRLVGTAQAGAGFAGTLGPGQCVRIFTGAPVPAGADAVVMQEQTFTDGEEITFLADSQPGKNIRPRGNDFSKGAVLVPDGATVSPAMLALIAAANHDTCAVRRAPKVALLATGDELVPPGGALGADQIVSSNSYGLAALLAPYCGEVVDGGIVADDRDALGRAIADLLAGGPDILITTGGASVGDHDFVQEMLAANGIAIDFWRLAMRPGRPLMFGRKGGTLVFGLPGNPVSALVTAQVLVLPAIRALLGAPAPVPLVLPLAEALPENGPRRHFLRARLVPGPDGRSAVSPLGQTDSGHLSSLAHADCLLVQREHDPGKAAGELVETLLLPAR